MLNNKQTLSNEVILLAFKILIITVLTIRCYGTMIQLSSNKITPQFQLLPMSKIDQSYLRIHDVPPLQLPKVQ